MVSNRVLKFILSLVIALISTLYQLESDDELLLTEKRVMLSKNKTFCFDSLTDLEQFPSFFPNLIKVVELNKAEHLSVGKRYTMHQTYIFGISESESQLTIIGYQKPELFEFFTDDFIKARHRLTFIEHESDRQKCRVFWNVYSRNKSYLFKYTLGIFYQFYYTQILREGLFALQFLVKDAN